MRQKAIEREERQIVRWFSRLTERIRQGGALPMALPFTVHVLMGYIMSPAIVPSCGAGPSRGSVTQAVVDPFSNPVFDNPDVTTAISQVPHQGLDHSQWETLAVGLLVLAAH